MVVIDKVHSFVMKNTAKTRFNAITSKFVFQMTFRLLLAIDTGQLTLDENTCSFRSMRVYDILTLEFLHERHRTFRC